MLLRYCLAVAIWSTRQRLWCQIISMNEYDDWLAVSSFSGRCESSDRHARYLLPLIMTSPNDWSSLYIIYQTLPIKIKHFLLTSQYHYPTWEVHWTQVRELLGNWYCLNNNKQALNNNRHLRNWCICSAEW